MSDVLVMSQPLVSVIIPTFNRGYCLAESISSVLIQSDFELIVVDDGSTDNTQKVLQKFPDIRNIPLPENRGVSYARNRGIEVARGSLICFLDFCEASFKPALTNLCFGSNFFIASRSS